MALIKCFECGKEVSDTSKKCIHCGAKIKKVKIKKNKKKLILILISIIIIIGIIITSFILFKEDEVQTNLRDENKNQVEIITEYINIRENPNISSDIIGKVYQGEIYDVLSENTTSEYMWIEIETSNGIRGYISGIDDYVKKLYLDNELTEDEPTDNTITNDDEENNIDNNQNTNDETNINNDTNNETNINNETNDDTEDPIIIKNIWMENEGGTFKVGDTITVHATVESKYKIKSGIIWLQSKVNNQSIKFITTNAGEKLNPNDIVIKGVITDDMLPGLWEYHWSNFDDQYGLYTTDLQTGRFQFTVM